MTVSAVRNPPGDAPPNGPKRDSFARGVAAKGLGYALFLLGKWLLGLLID